VARIGIDYTAAIHQQAGIGRYTRELVAALTSRPPLPVGEGESADEFVLFVAGAKGKLPPAPPGCRYAPSILSERDHARLWHRLKLPIPVELWTGGIDLFHATDFTLPPTTGRTRAVLTIHDLAFEKYPDETMPGMLDFLRRVVPDSARRADHIIAVSEATRRDIVDLYGIPEVKVTAIPHGVSPRFAPDRPQLLLLQGEGSQMAKSGVREKYRLPDAPLILTVGTLQPRKNHVRLIQAFAQIDPDARLVIAGGKGWGYDQALAEAARLKIAERVIFTGFVDDGDLPDLCRAATVFAYPALYEGFGLPVLEAMASGVPVVASNASSLPEVVGDAGLLVDPLDVAALADALGRALADSALRASLRERGITRAREFTWGRAAQLTREVYRAAQRA